jgi:hypothetical protein
MKCLGCNQSDWEYPDTSIARCKNCGYLLDPYVFGLKKNPPSSGNLQRSERSKLSAKIAFGVSITLFIASALNPDWLQFAIIVLAASVILFFDALMYS